MSLQCTRSENWVLSPVIGGESVASVVNVAIGTKLRHKKSINVSLAKQRRNGGNNRGNMKILGLAQLTLVASTGVPANILIEVRPPETQEKVASGREHSFVSQVVVGIPDKSETLFGKGNELRDTFAIPAKHQSICKEVVGGLSNQLLILFVGKVRRPFESG